MATIRLDQISTLSARLIPDWLIRFWVALLLIAIPVYPKFPLLPVPGTYVSVRLEDWLIAALVGMWLIKYAGQVIQWLLAAPFRYLVFYWLAGGLVVLSAWWVTQTGDRLLVLLHFLRRIEYMVLFVIIWSSMRQLSVLRYYLVAIWLALAGVVFYGVGQKLWMFPIISTMNREYSQGVAQVIMPGARINSTFAGHYDLAAYAVMMLNFWMVWWFVSRDKTGKLLSALAWLGSFWLLLASASRISFAAYLGSLVISLFLLRKYWWIGPMLLLSLFSSTLAPGLLARYSQSFRYEIAPRVVSLVEQVFPPTPTPTPTPTITPSPTPTPVPALPGTGTQQLPSPTATPTTAPLLAVSPSASASAGLLTPVPSRVPVDLQPEYVSLPEDRSTAIRFKVEWPRAIRAFAKNPLLGTGFSSITLATDNDYLRALGESGLLGLTAFLLLLTALVAQLWHGWQQTIGWKKLYLAGTLGMTAGFLANAVFIDVFEASKVAIYFWLLTGMAVASLLPPDKISLDYEP